jgi:ATP/maltotriose-dependent transcriptional regulator MalT
LLLDGFARLATEGHAAAAPLLRHAAHALAEIPLEDVLHWGWTATCASAAIWDYEGFCVIAARNVQLVRAAGAVAQLPLHLSSLAVASVWVGDFAAAASVIAEAERVAAATKSRSAPTAALRLRAMQGREPETSALIAATIKPAEESGHGIAVAVAHWAAAVLYNGLGRYGEAAAAAREAATEAFDPWVSTWVLPELIEASARAGDVEGAHDALERLVETTRPARTDLALAIEARCRALLSDGESAERLYQEAISRLSRTSLRPELARSRLLYGEWLRRQNRRIDARGQLRTAFDQFVGIGMEAFAEHARRELLATGERVRQRNVETRDDLTPQETQIVELARAGLSNPEIGARLFLSPRTVEWHLRKVFTKLGIHSRRELASLQPATASVPAKS